MGEKKVVMKCCVCNREKTELGWQYRFQPAGQNAIWSHGLCALCYRMELMKIKMQAEEPALALYR